MPDDVWHRVAVRVRDGVRGDVTAVNTLVVASTSDQLTEQRIGQARWQQLRDLFAQLRPNESLQSFYGASRREWKPQGAQTIDQMLSTISGALNGDGIAVRFENVDASFHGKPAAELRIEARKLSRQLALIVVDPFSLVDVDVETLFSIIGCVPEESKQRLRRTFSHLRR